MKGCLLPNLDLVLSDRVPINGSVTESTNKAIKIAVPARSGSRPLCEKLYGSGLFFTREEIQNISNQLGYSVFQLCGGWYTNPNTGRRTPFCRHEWKRNVVVEKTSR